MEAAYIHACETDHKLMIEFDQWIRLCSVLDSHNMVADGNIHYPAAGIASTHLLRGSDETVDGVIFPADLAEALNAREVDFRPLAAVHLEAMLELTRDGDDQPSVEAAQEMHLCYFDQDETAYRHLLHLLAMGASASGIKITLEGKSS